jgi:hypothetical protein
MNRLGTAVFAAVEAVVAVGVGLGIALVPLSLLWGFEYGLQIPWAVFWRAAGNIWLLGHGVDVTFVLDATAAKATGLSGAGAPIVLTIAALGFALLTAWIGSRSGRRLAETEHRAIGSVVAIAAVVVLSVFIALTSISVASRPSLWQSIVFPALWFGVPLLVSAELARRRRSAPEDPVTGWVLDQVGRIPAVWRAVVGTAARGGAIVAALVVAAAGVVVAFLVLGSYAEVITLYERTHADAVGGLSITIGQLAFVPDFVGWAVSWIVGPGFAIGTGSNVSPIGTTLGPIPGIPIFGALPERGHAFGLLSLLVPVLGGFLVAAIVRPRLVRELGVANSALVRTIAGAGIGVAAGILVGFVAAVSSGAFGPGRLQTVGASPWPVGAFAALEVGVPAIVALAVGSDLVRIPDRAAWGTFRDVDADEHERVAEPGTLAARDADWSDGSEPTTGGFIAALDRAGAGRTTDVHRFAVSETTPVERDHAPVPDASDEQPAAVAVPVGSEGAEATTSATAAVTGDLTDVVPDAPEDQRAVRGGRAPGLQTVMRSMRDRVSDAAERVRDAAGDVRERVSDVADDVRDRVAPDRQRPVSPERAGVGVDEQPGFPWRTEEFQAGHDELPPTAPTTVVRPPEPTDWDYTDEIPEHELPWWRKPKDGA